MPRKARTSAEELTALKAQQPILEENVRMATRALNANTARQREILKAQEHTKRLALGTAVDALGLTTEQIMEALAAKKAALQPPLAGGLSGPTFGSE